MLKSSSVINKCIFNNIALSFLIFHIFLITILITIFIFLIPLLIHFLYIHHHIIFYLSLLFNNSLSSSLFLILLINIKIYTFCEGFCLKTPKLKLKAFVCFKDISFKVVLRVNNKVFSRTEHAFTFSIY